MSGMLETARTWAEIDMEALLHNYIIAAKTGKKVLCVIKANAYGHGALRCARFLERHGAYGFAVACMAEALELRQGGIQAPILVLGYTEAKFAPTLARYDITQAICDETHAIAMDAEARRAGVVVDVHVKVDTGMSRTGILAQGPDYRRQAAESVMAIYNLRGLRVKGLFTHFCVADTPAEDDFTAWQLENYMSVMEHLAVRGFKPELCHTSNSACILDHPETQIDMVRAGVMLYGLYPDSIHREDGILKPVLTLKSRVAQIRDLPEGSTVSYGRSYTADAPITTAVITAGYADGFNRRLSNRTYDRIGDRNFRQVGTICMDMHMINITGYEDRVHRGDEVILWGGQGGMSCEEAAAAVGTINYELTCVIPPRVERVYLHEEI